MALLPNLDQISPGLTAIYQDMIQRKDFPKGLKEVKELIDEAFRLYDPTCLLENQDVAEKVDQAIFDCEILRLESESESSPSSFRQLLLACSKAFRAEMYLYSGQWDLARKESRECGPIAVKLVKNKRSALHLFFQAEIKALSARIHFTLSELKQAQQLFRSSLRLYRQAIKKCKESQGWLKEQIRLCLQRTSLKFADICEDAGRYLDAYEYYQLSCDCARLSSHDTIYALLLPECKDELEKELLKQLASEMYPEELFCQERKAVKEKEKEEIELMEFKEALLAARLKALLFMQHPDFYDLLTFFGVLYLLLEYWYVEIPEEERMSDSNLLALCHLFDSYLDSELYGLLFQDEWEGKDFPEKEKEDLGVLVKLFNTLAEDIASGRKTKTDYFYTLPIDFKVKVLERLYKFYEDKMFSLHTKEEITKSKEYRFYPIDAYLYLVALINQSNRRYEFKAFDYHFFDLCWSLEANYYYYSERPRALFFGERVLDCIKKSDPVDWFESWNEMIGFYTQLYHLYFATGNEQEGNRFLRKVNSIKAELFRSGFYDQDDWMFR